ncbi:MAG TPA: hypothetical protein VMT00_08710 [Thermoanaerobaculia bacterium]|nr:hypothetical protein [Thermoanaerobaculia bacterium]
MSPSESGRRRKNTLVAIALLVATFAAGALSGIVADRLVLFRQQRLLPKYGMRVVSSRVVDRLDRELRLSADQRREIEAILERHQAAIEDVWSAMQPSVRRQIEAANREIEATLTEGQRPRYRELRQRWERRTQRLFRER